ncbi:MAG: PKD domain-containing protein, partial [Myxococcota bacterium]
GMIRFVGQVPGDAAARLDALSEEWGAAYHPLIQLPAQALESIERRAAERSGRAQPDFAGMMVVDLPGADAGELEAFGEALQGFAFVERAYIEVTTPPPPGDIAPTTSDYTAYQDLYIEDDSGIDAPYAWDLGFTGEGLIVADVEYGWNPDHEEFNDTDAYLEAGQTIPAWVFDNNWDAHGTAVWGEMGASDGTYGVTGASYDVQLGGYPEWTDTSGSRRAAAILSAVSDLSSGNFILLEMQITGPGGGYGPAELSPNVWDATRTAVDAGMVVVSAAGNGGQNLDSAPYEDYRSWGDSGAIIVGAGSPDNRRDRLSYSTYGTRVDVQGIGFNVTTTGYGYLDEVNGDKNQRYTASFSGTSSSSPIVTSAGILIQDLVIALTGKPLESEEIRELLIETGRAQGSGTEIGPRPDVGAAFQVVIDDNPISITSEVVSEAVEGVPVVFYTDIEAGAMEVTVEWRDAAGEPLEPDNIVFPDNGTYEVEVTVSDDLERTASQTLSVEVANLPPTLVVDVSTTVLNEGDSFEGVADAVDVPADNVDIFWSLDGVQVGTGENVQLSVIDDGAYSLTVRAADQDGGEATESLTLTVENVPPSIDGIDITAETERVAGSFTASVSDPGDDTVFIGWDFGDGEAGEGETVTHTYAAAGSYTVTVTASDEDGGISIREQVIDIAATPDEGGGSVGCAVASPARSVWGLALLVLVGLRRRR